MAGGITAASLGDLTAPRVTPARAFLHTGVDYAGPVWLRATKGRGHRATKAFLVIFVCLSTRAVHLDVASDYSADAFLAALRRFVSRRGLCRALYSDCGTNFVGADKQLRALFAAGSQDGRRLAEHVAKERIEWHFNPPAAPNFGGLWEAAVKNMKHHLRRVIGEATLTYEEMATLLAQIEACLNSRPLQALSDDPEDFEALTPGHFLIGTALNAVDLNAGAVTRRGTGDDALPMVTYNKCENIFGNGGRRNIFIRWLTDPNGAEPTERSAWVGCACYETKRHHRASGHSHGLRNCIPGGTGSSG